MKEFVCITWTHGTRSLYLGSRAASCIRWKRWETWKWTENNVNLLSWKKNHRFDYLWFSLMTSANPRPWIRLFSWLRSTFCHLCNITYHTLGGLSPACCSPHHIFSLLKVGSGTWPAPHTEPVLEKCSINAWWVGLNGGPPHMDKSSSFLFLLVLIFQPSCTLAACLPHSACCFNCSIRITVCSHCFLCWSLPAVFVPTEVSKLELEWMDSF